MTSERWSDDEIVTVAGMCGWRLAEHALGNASMWRWLRRNDELVPSFQDRASAIAWMRERLVSEG